MAERHSPDPVAERQAQGHRGIALGWLKRGRVKQAIISLNQALTTDPGYLEAYLELGRILIHLHRWRDLVELCQRGLKYNIELPELHKMMITALEERGSLDDAYACYQLERRDQHCLMIDPDEILCCVVVRNERVRLSYFLRYYRQLGVDRFFFIDNDSSDGSVEWLLQQPDVHLWSSSLSFKLANYGASWFELLLRRHGVDHWCLAVDIDEFLLFEGAPERSLKSFCSDLDRLDKRAVTGMLLDMYSDRPIRATEYKEGDDPLSLCHFFDREFYHRRFEQGGQYHNQEIFFGGARQRLFPTEHDYLLSKVPLLRYQPNVFLASGQHLTNIPTKHLAHQQACLLHFKFLATFIDYARNEAAREIHAMGAEQYKAYHSKLEQHANLTLFDAAHSLRFEGTEQLIQLGVMAASERPPEYAIPAISAIDSNPAEQPFWSVMITVYDRLDHLERVLSSVLSQASDAMQIEVICDFSDVQRQAEIAAEVARIGDGRVHFHALPQRLGHPQIFNYCIERATGHWVHILHDDDWLEPGFYTALRSAIEAKPEVGAAFCQQTIIAKGSNQPIIWRSWVERETPGVIDDWLSRIALECRVQFSAMVVRRDVYQALGGFCAAARSAFDWQMWTRIAIHYPVYYLPETLVNVGRDDRAESSRLLRSGEQVLDALKAIDVSQQQLPVELADALSHKARDRIAAYALEVARQYFDCGDGAAAIANLRAAVAGRPSARTVRRVTELLQGVDSEFHG